MTQGYQCDHCGKFFDKRAEYAETLVERMDKPTLHVGKCCADTVEAFVTGEHRLVHTEPATVPEDADRDENGEAVFKQ